MRGAVGVSGERRREAVRGSGEGEVFSLITDWAGSRMPSTPCDSVPEPSFEARIAGCGGLRGPRDAGGTAFAQLTVFKAVCETSTSLCFARQRGAGDKIEGYGWQ